MTIDNDDSLPGGDTLNDPKDCSELDCSMDISGWRRAVSIEVERRYSTVERSEGWARRYSCNSSGVGDSSVCAFELSLRADAGEASPLAPRRYTLLSILPLGAIRIVTITDKVDAVGISHPSDFANGGRQKWRFDSLKLPASIGPSDAR